ncbi:MAG: hypothetical protein E4H17_02970, partial [Gemmatimonadales bacterium]
MSSRSSSLHAVESARVIILLAGMMLASLGLVVRLWQEQIVKAASYRTSLERQSVRRVRLPAVRGVILDRNGACLARNRPSYCVAVYVEELRKPGRLDKTVDEIERVLDHLSAVLELPRETDREDVRTHLRKRMPIPLLAWRNIPRDALARWAERGVVEPGVDIYVEPVREYPQGDTLGHVLGHVGRADPPTGEGDFHYYVPEMEGKGGVERARNDLLAGEPGGRLIRVDASGFRHDVIAERLPREGATISLTIDIDYQRAAESALAGDRAAAVVMDPR